MKALVAVAEVAGLAALIISGATAVVRHITDEDRPTATMPSPSASAPSADSPAASRSSQQPTTAMVIQQRCWTLQRAVVDCREVHRFEEIPQASNCDQDTVIGFLGGLVSLDVTIARAAKIPGGGCSVDAGREQAGSARDALQSDDAAAWRRCFDRSTAKNVACSGLHSGEYVATRSLRRATTAECQVAAAKYMGQDPGNLLNDLAVRPLDIASGTPDSARCIIDARGNHLLTTSVRGLGVRPVPISSE